MIVSATGHRPERTGGYGPEAFSKLVRVARINLARIRPERVNSGMALGWDQAVVQAAIDLKIPFWAILPCVGQERPWKRESQDYWRTLCDQAERVVRVTDEPFTAGCMQLRNVWLVDHCDELLALYDGGYRGGTFRCIQYARKVKRPVRNVWNEWQVAA